MAASRLTTLRLLFSFTHSNLQRLFLALFLALLAIACNIALLATGGYLIAMAVFRPALATLALPISIVRLAGLGRAGARYGERIFSHAFALSILAPLRTWCFDQLIPLAPAHLLHQRSGDILSLFLADVNTLEEAYLRVLFPAIVTSIGSMLIIILFAPISIVLGIVVVMLFWISALGIPALFHQALRTCTTASTIQRGILQSEAVDFFQGLLDLTLLRDALRWRRSQLLTVSTALLHTQQKSAWLEALREGLQNLVSGLILWCGLLFIIPLFVAGHLSGPVFVALTITLLVINELMQPVSELFPGIIQAGVAGSRLLALTSLPPAVTTPTHPCKLTAPHSITFDHVSFRYPSASSLTLHELSFHIPAGSWVTLAGPSGAGKTTLLQLIPRFWDPTSGTITIGLYPITAYDLAELRRQIALVDQNPYLFTGSIRENLLLANPHASSAEIEHAIAIAQLDLFLSALPRGLDTDIGEHGSRLSGGERQRLALARALLKNAPILLLDELSAHLDPPTEQALLHSIRSAATNRTILQITHRLTTISDTTHVILLQDGRIVEQGPASALRRGNSRFQHLYQAEVSHSGCITGGSPQ